MAVISDRAFRELLSRFKESSTFYYNEPINKLLGEGKWTKSDLQNTILKFTTSSESLSAESYYKDGTYWIKIYRGEDPTTAHPESSPSDSVPMRYFKKSVFYVFEYTGDIGLLPDWITKGNGIVSTNRPDGEFKLVLSEDDWFLIQNNDVIVYDVDKDRFTIYDSYKEVRKIFISEKEIAETGK